MTASLPVANFDINDLNLLFGNGVSDSQWYKDLFKALTSVTGLSTEALLKIGKHAAEAPAGFFSALGEINGQNVTDITSYEAALLATATNNTANVNCASVLKLSTTGFQKAYLNFAEVNNATSLINGIIASNNAAIADPLVNIDPVLAEHPLKVIGTSPAVFVNTLFQSTYCNSTTASNTLGRNATYDDLYFSNAFASISDSTTTSNLGLFRNAWDSICTSLASGDDISDIKISINTTATGISAYSTQLTDALINSTLNTAWGTGQGNLPYIRTGCIATSSPTTPLVSLYDDFTGTVNLENVKNHFAATVNQASIDLGSNTTIYYQQICGLDAVSSDMWNFCSINIDS